MPNLILIAVFALMTGWVEGSPFDPHPAFSIVRKDTSDVYLINYARSKTGNVIIVIKNHVGTTLTSMSFRGVTNFVLPVNFSSLAEGFYTVQIDDGIERQTRTINYRNDTTVACSHVFTLEHDRYLFTTSNSGSKRIAIRIFDGEGKLVFEQEKKIKGDFAMLFNLKNISGKPSFEVSENSGRSSSVSY